MADGEDGEDEGFFAASDSEEVQDPVVPHQQQNPVAPVDTSLLLSNGIGAGCPEPTGRGISTISCHAFNEHFNNAALLKIH